MRVYLITVSTGSRILLANGIDYSVTNAGAAANAIVTTVATYSNLYQLKCKRRTARLQETDYRDNDPFPAESHEAALDRGIFISQELDEDLTRAILAPDGEVMDALPEATVRANKILAFNNDGNPLATAPVSGDATDLAISLASTAIAVNGAGMVGYNPTLSYGAGTLGARAQQTVSITDYPWLAKGDSNGTAGNGTDNTAAITACYAWAAAHGYRVTEPDGVYRTTAPIPITLGLTVEGAGTAPYAGAVGTRGKGTWHFIDHAGRGFEIKGAASVIQSSVTLRGIGTCRVQPTPAPGWAPNIYDFDIYIDNTDVLLDDVMLLNPSHGVQLVNGHAGRLRTNYLRGQPMVVGVDFVYSADVCTMTNTQWWPFWKDHADVHAYTLQNLDTLKLGRCDNPQISNYFTIFARSGLRFYENAFGRTQNFRMVNVNTDGCNLGMWIDNTVTLGVSGQTTNFMHQGSSTISSSQMLLIDGGLNTLEFHGLNTQRCGRYGIKVNGTGNTVRISGLTIANYNTAAAGYAAVDGLVGNEIRIDGFPKIINGGAGAKYNGAANIFVNEWRAYTPTFSSGTGAITTMGAVNAAYKLYDDAVKYRVDATITTNGTAATNFRATVPYTQGAGTPNSSGHGREVAVTGDALTATLSAGSSTLIIQTYQNTYPGGDGRRICVEGEYPVT